MDTILKGENLSVSYDKTLVIPPMDPLTVRVRLGAAEQVYVIDDKNCGLYPDIRQLIRTIYEDYPYLLVNVVEA